MVTETVNPVYVTIANGVDFQNLQVTGIFEPDVPVDFTDSGAAPDETGGDFVFTGQITTPDVGRVATPFVLTVLIDGEWQEPPNPDDPNAEPADPVPVSAELSVTYTVVPRPLNDDFLEALKIPNPGGVALSTNNWASIENMEPLHGEIDTVAASVWWNWAPDASSETLIDLSGSSFDPVLAVYTGLDLDNLELVASSTGDDENQNLKANLKFDAVKGVTYRIAVAGQDESSQGNVRLRVLPGADVDLSGPQVNILSPATQAKFNDPQIRIRGLAKDPYANAIGVKEIFATVNGGAPQLLEGTLQWSGDLTLESGTNIIEVYGVDHAGNEGNVDTIVAILQIPANDFFADAEPLLEVAGNISGSNEDATKEEGEPFHAENDGGRSVWYQFIAPSNGELNLSTEGSDFDTVLAVYSGESIETLESVSFNDDFDPSSGLFHSELVAELVGGVTYWIAVDGFGGDSGAIELEYIFVTKEVFYGLEIEEVSRGTTSPANQLFLAGTTVTVNASAFPGFQFVRWEGSIPSEANPLIIEMNSNVTLLPVFEQFMVTEDFESGVLDEMLWNANLENWSVVQSGDPAHGFVIESGFVVDGNAAVLSMEQDFLQGLVTFDYFVSSEETWDRLEFRIDDELIARWSGETGWRHFEWPLEAGAHSLEWKYVKDNNFSEGMDLARLDNILVPLETNPEPVVLKIENNSGLVVLSAIGEPSQSYVIESTENFSDWTQISTVIADEEGNIQWEDPEFTSSEGASNRFYRVFAE